jgi:hypothetical protein
MRSVWERVVAQWNSENGVGRSSGRVGTVWEWVVEQ